MVKRIFLTAVLLVLFSVSVLAKTESIPTVNTQGEFFSFNENKEKVSEILNLEIGELEDYCTQNGIIYLAVNSDNTKQIKLASYINDFSKEIENLSGLSDEKILKLSPDITGLNLSSEVKTENGQKFIQISGVTKDSGGEYTLTQYFTVANKKYYVLSFYTSENMSTEYIEEIFKNYALKGGFGIQNKPFSNVTFYTVIALTVLFSVICAVIIVSFFKKPNGVSEDTQEI